MQQAKQDFINNKSLSQRWATIVSSPEFREARNAAWICYSEVIAGSESHQGTMDHKANLQSQLLGARQFLGILEMLHEEVKHPVPPSSNLEN